MKTYTVLNHEKAAPPRKHIRHGIPSIMVIPHMKKIKMIEADMGQ